jgi:hypothetical protein
MLVFIQPSLWIYFVYINVVKKCKYEAFLRIARDKSIFFNALFLSLSCLRGDYITPRISLENYKVILATRYILSQNKYFFIYYKQVQWVITRRWCTSWLYWSYAQLCARPAMSMIISMKILLSRHATILSRECFRQILTSGNVKVLVVVVL